MTGLPRIPRMSRPRTPWGIFVVGGMERLTRSLMEGDEFDEESLRDLRTLAMRATAFVNALEVRKRAAGIQEPIEEPETQEDE